MHYMYWLICENFFTAEYKKIEKNVSASSNLLQ